MADPWCPRGPRSLSAALGHFGKAGPVTGLSRDLENLVVGPRLHSEAVPAVLSLGRGVRRCYSLALLSEKKMKPNFLSLIVLIKPLFVDVTNLYTVMRLRASPYT